MKLCPKLCFWVESKFLFFPCSFFSLSLVTKDQKTLDLRHISYWKHYQNWQIYMQVFYFSEIIYFNENSFCWNAPDSSSCEIFFICHFQLSQTSITSSPVTLMSLWSPGWDPSKLFHLRYENSFWGWKTNELIYCHTK